MIAFNKIFKESSINFSGSVVGNILNYIWLMILTRTLQQDDIGLFTLAQSIINISLIFALLGTHRALDRYIPIFNTQRKPGKIKSLIRLVFIISLFSSLVIGALLFWGSDHIGVSWFNKPDLTPILRVILISIPLLAVINIIIYAFIGYKELRYNIFLKQLLEPALRILGALMIAIYGLQVIEWSLIYVVSLVISALVGIWFFYRRIISPLQRHDREPVNIKEIISYSWPISIASILTILIGQIDYILIGLYYPSADVGIYRIYIQIAAILQLILGSTARIYKPVISELIPQEQFTSIKETYQRVSRWVLTLTLLGFLVILLYGDVLVRALFTDAYGAYPAALSLLVLGILLNSSFGPEGVTLQAFGNTRLVLMNSLFSLLVNVGLGLLLIPRYGIVGAAVSTAITISLAGLLGMIEIYWLYRMQPFTFATLKIIGVGFFSGLIFAGINQFAPTSKISINLLRIVLLTIVFGLGFLLSRSMDSEDRQLIRQILQRITPNIS